MKCEGNQTIHEFRRKEFVALLTPRPYEEDSMTPDQVSDQLVPSKVSIIARLVPSLSYVIAMLGAVVSAMLIIRTFQAMRNAETAGIAAVAAGMAEASQAVAILVYLAIFVGVIGLVVMVVRLLTTTATASPSGWFFLISGGLGLVPVTLLWKAESLLIEAISPGFRGGVVQVASAIQMCLTLTLITAGAFSLTLLVGSLVPLPAMLKSKRGYAPMIVLVLMELALTAIAVGFQLRASWLHQVGIRERF